MKTIFCAIHNIKKLIKQHIFLFCIICIGIAMSTFGILFYTGYISNYFCDSEDGQTVNISIKDNNDISRINDLADDLYNIDGFNYIAVSGEDYQEYDTLNSNCILGEYSADFDDNLLVGDAFDFNSMDNVALITEYAVMNMEIDGNPVGTKVNNDSLKVVGVLNFNLYEGYIVPVKYYINNFETKVFYVKYSNAQGDEIRDLINEKLSGYSDIIEDCSFEYSSPFDNSDFVMIFMQILLIFCVAVINIFTMISFWVKSLKNEFKIYMVYGSSKMRIIVIMMLQSIILFVLSSLLGIILFFVCSGVFVDFGIIIRGHIFTYVTAYAIVLLISVVQSFILALRAARQQEIYKIKE